MIKIFYKLSILIIACFFVVSVVFAQSPTGFNYQGVALTSTGTPVLTKKISLRLSLLEASATGAVKYQELHGLNTDAYGQFSVVVGTGQPVAGKFSDLQWSKVAYFLKSEIDVDGATNFVNVGTSQLMSVPYALYANTSGAASVNVDSILNELKSIKLVQKGDSILLNNNRGAVFVQKIDSLSQLAKQLAQLKTQYDGTTDSILTVLNKKYDSLAKVISDLNTSPTIPSTSNTVSTMKFISRGLDSVLMPSVYFDGSQTYIQVGSVNLGNALSGKSFTIETWVKSIKSSDTAQVILSSGVDGSGWVHFQVRLINGKIVFQTVNSSGIVISTDYPKDSLWHHIAVTVSEKKSSAIFVDGIEKIRSNNTGSGISNSPNLTIGAFYNTTYDGPSFKYESFYKGNLRKLRISKGVVYNVDFNPSSKYGKADSTIVFWDLNEGSGSKIINSDTSYNAILYNGAWQTNDTNTLNSVRDVDGNVYKTVKIGTQVWMAENLKTTKYRNGLSIQEISDLTQWRNLTTPAFSFYDNLSSNNNIYGKLYNYYVLENVQKVCPNGWRLPSIDDFNILENYLGKDSAGFQMKTQIGWSGSNGNGNNRSGFSALPAGARSADGSFTSASGLAFFWTNSFLTSTSIQWILLNRDNRYLEKRLATKNDAYSIRCIKE